MSSPGSSFGWVFPAGQSKQQILDETAGALEQCGYSVVQKPDPYRDRSEFLQSSSESGLSCSFVFLTGSTDNDGHVLYASSRTTFFRPFDLDLYPEWIGETQANYDLAKQIFDLTSAIECFGFHNSQDNAVVFEDSNLDFFFMKKGVQLTLAHLDERRALTPDEWKSVGSREDEYEPLLRWDQLLHSTFFTRFSDDAVERIIRVYNIVHRLIESDWDQYYARTP